MLRFNFWNFKTKEREYSDDLLQISCTALKQGKECPKRLYLMLTVPKPPKNHYLTCGSVFHSVMEHYFTVKAKTGQDMAWQGLYSTFLAKWDREKPGTIWGEGGEEMAKTKCANLIKVYLLGCKTLIPAGLGSIEKFITFNVKQGERAIRITGKVDLICSGGHVCDHKSGQVRNPEDEPQAYLYPIGLKACGTPVNSFQFRVVNGVTVKSLPVPFSQEKANEWLALALQLQKDFSENVILEDRRHCKFCDYKQACGI